MKKPLLVASVLGVLAIGSAALYGLTAPTFDQLREQGKPIITQLEEYYREHGKYPLSELDAGITLPNTRYGNWKYVVRENGRKCQLSVGEYDGWDPFILYWHSDRGEWYLDH